MVGQPMNRNLNADSDQPNGLQAWEDFIEQQVYPQPGTKARADYRNYDHPARDTVREFYRQNHRYQTFDFVARKRDTFLNLNHRQMSIFEALEYLNTLIDDSDPDIELDQLQHLLQTSEAIRGDGHEDWFVLTGLVHRRTNHLPRVFRSESRQSRSALQHTLGGL
jgi:inositol oxygenase